MFGFSEPEILYPPGTELLIELTAPLIRSEVVPSDTPVISRTSAEHEQMLNFVRAMPFRTSTQAGNNPSDLTNLLFLGPPEGLRRAFTASGWVQVDQRTAASTFQTLKSIAGDEGYRAAPMSMLLLDEQQPVFTLSKTTNTFSARHHLRVFAASAQYQGQQALTASSTQDIGIAFSRKQKTFIHVIDEYIDNERSKVVNDLSFTGCVEGMELVPRPWVPEDAHNATGDRLRTDGAIAVLRMNECRNPKTIPGEHPAAPRLFQRSVRNTMLVLRNNVWRGNVVYQGVNRVRKLHGYLSNNGELNTEQGAWRRRTFPAPSTKASEPYRKAVYRLPWSARECLHRPAPPWPHRIAVGIRPARDRFTIRLSAVPCQAARESGDSSHVAEQGSPSTRHRIVRQHR